MSKGLGTVAGPWWTPGLAHLFQAAIRAYLAILLDKERTRKLKICSCFKWLSWVNKQLTNWIQLKTTLQMDLLISIGLYDPGGNETAMKTSTRKNSSRNSSCWKPRTFLTCLHCRLPLWSLPSLGNVLGKYGCKEGSGTRIFCFCSQLWSIQPRNQQLQLIPEISRVDQDRG